LVTFHQILHYFNSKLTKISFKTDLYHCNFLNKCSILLTKEKK
jgi:hypothetical protein